MADLQATPTSKLRKIARLGSSVAAQTIASLASLLLAVVVARSLDQTMLGVFSLITATTVIMLGVVRALSTELIVFRDATAEDAYGTGQYDGCTSANLLLGCAGGVLVAASGFVFTDFSAALLVAGAIVPMTTLQDHCRFILIHERRSTAALVTDVVFFAAQAIGLVVAAGSLDLAHYLVPWLAAATISALLGLWLCPVRVRIRDGVRWVRVTWPGGRAYLADFVTTNGVSQSAMYIVSAFGGAAAAGALRGAQILLAPLQLILRGGLVALGSEASLLARKGRHRALFVLACGYSAAGAVGSAVVVATMYLAPDRLVVGLLGETSDAAMAVLPFAGAASAGLCIAMGAGLALRSVGLIRKVVRVKVIFAPLSLVLVILGSWSAGAAGSQAALAAAEAGRAVGSWREFALWNKGRK
ncbi:hypothetical protein LCL87_04945 [Rhodococcus hoagii]|nr:hypothetical protein [Prescottella equi]